MSKIKIAFVFNHSYFLGGGENSFINLIKCLDKNRFDPLIIVPGKGEIARSAFAGGIDFKVCSFPSLRKMVIGVPFLKLAKLVRVLNKKNIDLIHVNGSRACFYGGIAGRLLGTPMIWHVRETIQDFTGYEQLLGRLSAAIICVSKSVQVKRFANFGPRINNKINIAYNGVDTQDFIKDVAARGKIRRQFDIDDRTLFGMVGNLIPLKGHDVFLKGLAQAKKLRPNLAVKAIFLGRFLDTGYKQKLYRLTDDLNLQDVVIFNGYSDDIATYLSAFDVFALPSQREGCSRALLEAMSVGLPVIASKISEIEEVVRPDKNAIFVEYGDVSQMAAAIIELAENKKLREMLGRENRNRAQTVFGMRSHVDSIQHVYENLLMKTDKKNTYAHSI